MPIYSSSSLKAHPWLWKYDSRRDGRCHKIGHRHRWFHHHFKSYHGFFGICIKCRHVAFYRLSVDDNGIIVRAYKQFGKVIEVSKEEAEQMIYESGNAEIKAREAENSQVNVDQQSE